MAELPIFLGAKLPDLGPRGGSVAGHPQRSRRGRLLRGATLAAAAAAARGRGRDCLTNEKNGVFIQQEIPTIFPRYMVNWFILSRYSHVNIMVHFTGISHDIHPLLLVKNIIYN